MLRYSEKTEKFPSLEAVEREYNNYGLVLEFEKR